MSKGGQLLRDSGVDFGVCVTEAESGGPARAIQIALAGGVEQIAAFASHETR
jgi:hypothetical protein